MIYFFFLYMILNKMIGEKRVSRSGDRKHTYLFCLALIYYIIHGTSIRSMY